MLKLVCSICKKDLKFVDVSEEGDIMLRCSDEDCENGWDDVVELLSNIGDDEIFDTKEHKMLSEIIDEQDKNKKWTL